MSALVLLAALSGLLHPAPGRSQARSPLTREHLEKELELASTRLLTLLEKGEPKQFPALCAEEGVVFGLEPPPVARKEIQRQMERKEGAYCVLFDSACLRKPTGEGVESVPSRISLRERLRRATAREQEIAMRLIETTWVGELQVYLEGKPSVATSRNQPLEFSFEYKDGRWRLIAITY